VPATVVINTQPAAAVQNGVVFPTVPVVTVTDGAGNPVASQAVTVSVATGAALVFTNGTATTNGSGVATFTGLIATGTTGARTLEFAAGGALSSPSTGITVQPGPANALQSTATVPAGVVGSVTTITVQARDASGNALTTGGNAVAITVSGTNAVGALTVLDNGNGTYTASYTPGTAGSDMVSITLDGTAVGGSPFSSVVTGTTP
jgi:hypothetical protein